MGIGLTIFLIFLGSFLLTLGAILFRWWLTRQAIASFADLVVATAAYEISLYAADEATRTALVKNGFVGNTLKDAGLFAVAASGVIYLICLRMGEFRWVYKNDQRVIDAGLHRTFYVNGMIFGWLLPVAWMAAHLIVIFVEL